MLVNRFVRYSRQGAIRLLVVAPLATLALVPVSVHAGGGPPPPPLQNVSVKVDKHVPLSSPVRGLPKQRHSGSRVTCGFENGRGEPT
jgi:hypothetical protein